VRTALGTLVTLLLLAVLPGSAAATTTRYVLHTAAYQVEDACNGGVVVLSGDFVITQTTTPARDGGTNVRSRITSTNLEGVDENGLGYRALDAELSFVHELPQQPTVPFTDVHATLLLPRANASKMLLVTIFKENVAPDGTPSVALDRSYTVCLRHGQGSS
jgi:hypothetical protein